ncbi:MAG: bifunctional helix-turn-helix transcriptional regulator/GNAT family N-acetyltransferase [Hyphomicrobiales bacterium]|nr:bifunctional helix-turn-helix transcriptional regulator/GNAT family N-acetyltransferase [Hyphomicrobiales bacterium]
MPDAAAAIRRFNRFYTREIGVLDGNLLQSGFSLAEARIIYELAQQPETSATEIGEKLNLDRGYLSRMLQAFQRKRLISRKTDPTDKRRTHLSLTEKGRATFRQLDRRSSEAAKGMIASLPPGTVNTLLAAMDTIQGILAKTDATDYILRRDRVGDLGIVASRQGLIYEQEYGWDKTYEALAAKILSEFVNRNDAGNERAWIAESHGAILGSVYLMKEDADTARLRLLHVEPQARGLGLGKKLVSECTSFAREAGYKRIVLWTQSSLTAARKLYVEEGYKLIKQEPHHSFGKDHVGETWELVL